MDEARAAFEQIQANFGGLVAGLSAIKWEDLPANVTTHIANNPKMSAVGLLSFLIVAVPGLVAGPALAALGFGSVGPVAGSWAAAHQSAYGVSAIFSALQSAAMGGYGATVVGGVVQGGAAMLGVLSGVVGYQGGNGAASGGEVVAIARL
ncbi:putative integral membrane protein-2 [Elsinoe australis]|uniref:Putative integral membrane protein-2 n=1 Tax=Elsinoe australis TaxID=40998 RepID=A0A4U7B5N1_9PEZI|nr:putative integral membrane protein-2 [Elsinoe australis]